MIKRLLVVTVVMALLAMPLSLFAKDLHQFAVGKAEAKGATTLIVPLEISNADNLVALDIPLKFSDGVTLKEVNFDNTRISYFDFKISNIDNENNTVIIGALPQMSMTPKPDLKAGQGLIANLVFEIDDPSVNSVTIEQNDMEDPWHRLMFVYHEYEADGSIKNVTTEYPEFGSALAFSNPADQLPTEYNLAQNYPNPFNPKTQIAFALPHSGKVKLVIYNVLGQEVETLVDGEMEAGNHTVGWEASKYSSGVYFYRLDAERYTQTLKMMLLK